MNSREQIQAREEGGGGTDRKAYCTSMALSTMNNLLVTQRLRRGDGPFQYPVSRKSERLFGEHGRSKRKSTRIKLEKLGCEYNPAEDTCIKSFVRLMAQAAAMREDEQPAAPAAPAAHDT